MGRVRRLGTGRAPLPPLTERTRSPTCRVPARWAAPPSAMREMKIPCRGEGRRALYYRLAWPCPPAALPGPAHPPHRVSSPVGCGAFPPSDAEAQALVAAHEAGHATLAEGPWRLGLARARAQPASPPLPGAVVVLRPQRRDGDRVLGLHHTLPPQPHVHGGARATQRLHGLLMLGVLQGHAVHLQATALVRAGPSTGGQAAQGTGTRESGGSSPPLLSTCPPPVQARGQDARWTRTAGGGPSCGSTPRFPDLETPATFSSEQPHSRACLRFLGF